MVGLEVGGVGDDVGVVVGGVAAGIIGGCVATGGVLKGGGVVVGKLGDEAAGACAWTFLCTRQSQARKQAHNSEAIWLMIGIGSKNWCLYTT